MPLHDHFRENLRRRRLELEMTQTELGDRMGCSHAYVSQVENGVSTPSLDVVEKFAKALNWSPLQLLVEPADSKPAKKVPATA